ncbi:type II secretion system protein [Mucisphaera calidilacus]|uniref:Uncharacterized protein n=1 Tax=Mucisphaera calidilacus TaxID=2527982 RepID=A0A518BZK3_9BACT|nr:prepilin-type N-terminal cleavage/methylation domain-containing protein [Mucisphaera calidilacus]QDU72398.1 hypothetical protein Pan265_22630 [Mucisphaera calidilacus]
MARRTGFTLIELLVVISIIALLIGILLPALGSARALTLDMICTSNTRSLMQAYAAYTTDNDETLPLYGLNVGGLNTNSNPNAGRVTNPSATGFEYGIFPGQWDRTDSNDVLAMENSCLAPYIGDLQSMICPLYEKLVDGGFNPGETVSTAAREGMASDEIRFTYSINNNMDRRLSYEGFSRVSHVRDQSGMAVFLEENPFKHERFGSNWNIDDGLFNIVGGSLNWPNLANTLATFHGNKNPGRYADSPYPVQGDAYHGDYNHGVGTVGFLDGHAATEESDNTLEICVDGEPPAKSGSGGSGGGGTGRPRG